MAVFETDRASKMNIPANMLGTIKTAGRVDDSNTMTNIVHFSPPESRIS
jgi:hypothetical protein